MRARTALLILAALAAGCSKRPHSNPFDPANPETGGRPAGFVALAGRGVVDLRWNPPGAVGDVQFQVFRRAEGEADFRALSSLLPGTATGLGDFGLSNGLKHEYRLYYVFSGTLGGLPAEDSAIPGPGRVYVTELDRPALDHVTPDGRHIRTRVTDMFGPTHLAFDRTRSRLWVSDSFDGSVRSYDADLTPRGSIVGLSEPVAIAIDSVRDEIWVCDQARNAVYHYSGIGLPRDPTSIGPLSTPTGVALDPADGSLWVCERNANQVRRFFRSGTPISSIAVVAPSRIAVDSTTRDAWVSSFDGRNVVHLLASGAPVDTIPLQGPIGIAVDWRRGRIWVADARAGQVVAMRRSGLIEFTVGGLSRVNDVSVDLATGDCWATAPGVSSAARIGADGTLRQWLPGLANPYGVLADSGP